MIPDFETNQDIAGALFIISTLSPKAADSLENESYRFTADSDGSTPQYILEDTFQNLIKDLETTGLILNFDYSDYVEEMGTLFSFLRLASVILPNSLYPTMKTNRKIRELVERIVSGDIGDNNTFIEVYLTELGGLDGQPPLYPELADFIDQLYPSISQTELFSNYFRNMVKLIGEESLMKESDHETHSRYLSKIKDLIGNFSDAINLFSNDPRYAKMSALQNMAIRDFLSPINFVELSYIFLETVDTIPEDLVELYNRKWYHYFVGNPWCLEYYTVRNISIHEDDGIWPTLLCFSYALLETFNSFTAPMAKIKKVYPNNSDVATISSLYIKKVDDHG